jgi:NAD+ synthase
MAKRIIDAEKEVQHIVDEIKHYFVNNGNENTKAIIGISGGKDSTIAAALLVRALGPDRVIGVLMPQGVQTDINEAREVCEILDIPSFEIDIGRTFDTLTEDLPTDLFDLRDDNSIYFCNTPARLRMTTLYAVAGMVGGRVINTGNASELYVGYTTKYGDLAGDFAILRDYYVRDVYAIGDALTELPYELVHKTPGDGMSGKTDEDNMGFTYEALDAYLLDNEVPDYEILRNIQERRRRNEHKHCVQLPYIRAATRHWDDPNHKPSHRHGGCYEEVAFSF